MSIKLFVGNLPFSLNEDHLHEIFSQAGKVVSVSIPIDRESGRKRGFAFVEMESQSDADQAIQKLNNSNLDGRQIVVNPSRPREQSAAPRKRGGW